MEDTKIQSILDKLTLEEKCLLTAGKNLWETHAVERLNIPSLKMTDGPAGVRGSTWTDGTHTTYIPCGISLGATFDPALIESVGTVLGAETRSKRSHVLLAPTMNISRSPLGGRNFENFGEDPYLTGVMATSYIQGVQSQGVGACMKHYVANDMETRRFNMDQQIDERTLREIYIKPFQMALEAEPWTAMASYPKVNGEHVDCSSFLLRDILRDELGFDRLIVSDWGGTNDTVKSIEAGMDLEMPGPPIRYGQALLEAVKEKRVAEKYIDESVFRLIKLLDQAGLDPNRVSAEKDKLNDEQEKNSDLPEFRKIARQAASDSIVLLKNSGRLLPLDPKKIGKLAILGPNAKTPTTGGTGSAAVNPYYITTPFESITNLAKDSNPDVSISYAKGIETNLQPRLAGSMLRTPDGSKQGVRVDFYRGHDFAGEVVKSSYWNNSMAFMMSDGDTPECLRGQDHCYRLTGTLTPAEVGTYRFSLSCTGKAKLFIDDKVLIDNYDWSIMGGTFMNCGSANRFAEMALESGRDYQFRVDNLVVPPPIPPHDNTLFHTLSGVRVGVELRIDEQALYDDAIRVASEAEAVILVVGHNNDTEKEGVDRASLDLPRATRAFVRDVCRANPSTVVVTQSACAIDMSWEDTAPAIVHAWYQGQENGNALADVIFGLVNPSGKLPLTFPKRMEDHGSHPWCPGDAEKDHAEYGEGILVGYRWFDAKNIEPQWSFGYGLSYTTFSLSDAKVSGALAAKSSGPGSQATISLTVTNTGSEDGAEVVQVYVSSSEEIEKKGRDVAPWSLAGFAKVWLRQGESKSVEIPIGSQALAWFDVDGKGGPRSGGRWRVDPGLYRCCVGTSSRDTQSLKIDLRVE